MLYLSSHLPPKSKSENCQFWAKNSIFTIFRHFQRFFAYFQALVSVANFNQNTTCYSVLELVECGQQYSGQFVVIYSTCQKLLVKNQTEGPGTKIGRFQSTISNSQNCSIGKLFTPLKTMKYSEHFRILHIARRTT